MKDYKKLTLTTQWIIWTSIHLGIYFDQMLNSNLIFVGKPGACPTVH